MKNVDDLKIAFVGMGEAGGAIAGGWGAERAGQISAYDIKLDDAGTRAEILARGKELGITCSPTLKDAVSSADLVFSTVTADQAVTAAGQAAPLLKEGAFWCDLNSCAPASKQQSCKVIQTAGGRYVDVAVMAPVYPKRNLVPVLISGDWVTDILPVFNALPMDAQVVDGPVGRASSVKMVRSIMVKGMEALTAECALAAVAAGVLEEVMPSLKSGHPKIDVVARAMYNFDRSSIHGKRRASEMDEVAEMLTDLGLPNSMSRASAVWQRKIAEHLDFTFDTEGDGDHVEDLGKIASQLLPALKAARGDKGD